jgi:nucleoside-diphosphate-sugar epimerase
MSLEKPAQIERRGPMPADVRATWADITKAKRLLGWSPEVRLEDGLQACVQWYLSERDWARHVPTQDTGAGAGEGEA